MKRHSTWMLCKSLPYLNQELYLINIEGSLIISSVAAGESFPFIIQGLWHGSQQWVSILISTLSLAVFAEILPQYIIPKHAIDWGYFFSPLIWTCMFLTGVLSYPLALLLDALSRGTQTTNADVLTNQEVAALVRYHDRTERNGGMIGQDATRIMLGALQLNSRKIGCDITRVPGNGQYTEKDVEKGKINTANGMIVGWSAVKTIDIDEPVDGALIRKIKSWSYSRIPVLGGRLENTTDLSEWNGKQLFGFLHIKVRRSSSILEDVGATNSFCRIFLV